MITEHTVTAFGSAAVSAFAIVWFVMWTMERAADQERSSWPGVLFTTSLGVGIITLHWHAATTWIDWASNAEASTAVITSALGVLAGGLLGILLLEPKPGSQEEPPYVAIRSASSDADRGNPSGTGSSASGGTGSSPSAEAGQPAPSSGGEEMETDELVQSLVNESGDDTSFDRSDDPRPNAAGEGGGD